MSPPTFNIFPEFKKNYSYYALQKNLELVESVVQFSRGQFLGPKKIELIKEKLGKKLIGTQFYAGGSSVLFGWSFPSEQVGRLMYKPYYSRHLTQLLIHYFCISDFLTTIKKINLEPELKEYRFITPKVIGIAKIEAFDKEYPILIVEEVQGDTIKEDLTLVKAISHLTKKLAKSGLICDPYPANWKYYSNQDRQHISYIDLLSSNMLKDINSRIASLIQQLQ
ncbi:MAG: hypothetical protein ACW97Z_00135 [Candidatus Hodarchaeales archaeon]|jgi:hypothetical protein